MSTAVGTPAGRARLPIRSRDRRPALAALALLLIIGGGLGAGLIVYRTGQQTDVLVANTTLHPGDVVSRSDLTTVRISGAGDQVVPASNEDAFIGSVATTTIPSGAIINSLMFHEKKGLIPSDGQSLGISVPASQRPSQQFTPGDIVQAFYVPPTTTGSDDTTPPKSTPIADPVLVIGVTAGNGGTTTTIVSVLVTDQTAAEMAIPASQGAIVLTKLPYGTRPELTLTSG